jgi:hypothetical protein
MPTAPATLTVTVGLVPQLPDLVVATPGDTGAALLEDSSLTLPLLSHCSFVSSV